MDQQPQQKLIPIDAFVLNGFAAQFQQVFNCPCMYSNQNDRTQILEHMFGQGAQITYPYAWFVLNTVSHNIDSYNSHAMGRRGLVFNVPNHDQYQTVKVVPVNFDIEVYYVTDQWDSVDQGSITAFIRRWMLARRFGYLKTTVKYGKLKFGIGLTMAEQIQIPQRENIVENETKYELSAQITIHGYVSEPVTQTIGRINEINVIGGMEIPGGKVVSLKTLQFDPNQQQPELPTGRNLTRVRAKAAAKAAALAAKQNQGQ